MAPTKNFTHPVAPADDKPPNISLSLKKTTFLANGHPILHQVPPNITLTPSVPHSNSTGAGCFMGFTAHEPSSRHVTPVGKLKGIKFMSIFRFKVWWSTLLLGLNGKHVELETQIMILSNDDDLGRPYVLLLPIIEGTFRSSLQAGVHNDDYLDICVESGSTRVSKSRFTSCLYVHADHDPYRLVKDAMRVVRFHLNTFKLLEEKKPPEIIDKFGWCTWDAVYYKVDTQSIRNGIKSLVEGGCPPNWIIIDDGWQCIWHDDQELHMEGMERMVAGMLMPRESPRLKSFEVNEKFRNYKSCRGDSDKAGMGAFIRDVKDEFKTLNHVYVWHAFLGYWGGIRPNTSGMPSSKLIAPKLSHALGKTMDDLAINQLHSYGIGFVEPERAGELYDGLHSYLASVGIDGVKIDVTHLLEMVSEEYGGTVEVGKAYYKALSDSITKYFNGNGVIASMEQGNDFMFLGTEVISLGRAGDDFWVADPAGDPSGTFWLQGIHMVHCAYNSLWLGNFIHPDWDMFQSTHPLASFHAASRAISGGPIYISDRIGEHNFDILKTLVLPDGSILRCQSYALPTRDCLFEDPLHDAKTTLKLWNLNKYTGVLGLFNCQGARWCRTTRRNIGAPECSSRIHCLASPKDIEWNNGKNPFSVARIETFAVYLFLEKKLLVVKAAQVLEFALEPHSFELLTVSPVQFLSKKSIQFAPVGLVNMLNCGGVVECVDVEESSVKIGVKGSGHMRVFASEEPRMCKIDGVKVDFYYNDYMVRIEVPWPGSPGLSIIKLLF